jgi:hypothetical protein
MTTNVREQSPLPTRPSLPQMDIIDNRKQQRTIFKQRIRWNDRYLYGLNNGCIYLYIHTFIRMHTYTHAYIRPYKDKRIHTFIHTCMHIGIYTFIQTHIYAAYIHPQTNIYIHICILRTHTYIQTYLAKSARVAKAMCLPIGHWDIRQALLWP